MRRGAVHKKRLKETSGIGTVATRAAIIEELKAERCQYLLLKGGKNWTADQAQVPADVIDRLRNRLKGEMPETVAELRRVTENLAKSVALDKPAFAVLDRVCEAADATASAAFRRLRRI